MYKENLQVPMAKHKSCPIISSVLKIILKNGVKAQSFQNNYLLPESNFKA